MKAVRKLFHVRAEVTPKYINLEVLLLATWRYERNPHATGFLKCDKITEFKAVENMI